MQRRLHQRPGPKGSTQKWGYQGGCHESRACSHGFKLRLFPENLGGWIIVTRKNTATIRPKPHGSPHSQDQELWRHLKTHAMVTGWQSNGVTDQMALLPLVQVNTRNPSQDQRHANFLPTCKPGTSFFYSMSHKEKRFLKTRSTLKYPSEQRSNRRLTGDKTPQNPRGSDCFN